MELHHLDGRGLPESPVEVRPGAWGSSSLHLARGSGTRSTTALPALVDAASLGFCWRFAHVIEANLGR